MKYWIDGYNLLFRVARSYKAVLEQERKVLILLNGWVTEKKVNATIVFDGRQKDPDEALRTNLINLAIIYTPHNQSADAYILEEITNSKDPSRETVISSDRELTGRARQNGAKTQTIEAFLSSIIKKKKQRESSHEKVFQESERELQRLLEIFEEKLKA